MSRELLSNRRKCSTQSFEHGGLRFDVCAGFYPDDRIGEIFLATGPLGKPISKATRA
jgi:hypothetical protein